MALELMDETVRPHKLVMEVFTRMWTEPSV